MPAVMTVRFGREGWKGVALIEITLLHAGSMAPDGAAARQTCRSAAGAGRAGRREKHSTSPPPRPALLRLPRRVARSSARRTPPRHAAAPLSAAAPRHARGACGRGAANFVPAKIEILLTSAERGCIFHVRGGAAGPVVFIPGNTWQPACLQSNLGLARIMASRSTASLARPSRPPRSQGAPGPLLACPLADPTRKSQEREKRERKQTHAVVQIFPGPPK